MQHSSLLFSSVHLLGLEKLCGDNQHSYASSTFVLLKAMQLFFLIICISNTFQITKPRKLVIIPKLQNLIQQLEAISLTILLQVNMLRNTYLSEPLWSLYPKGQDWSRGSCSCEVLEHPWRAAQGSRAVQGNRAVWAALPRPWGDQEQQ